MYHHDIKSIKLSIQITLSVSAKTQNMTVLTMTKNTETIGIMTKIMVTFEGFWKVKNL